MQKLVLIMLCALVSVTTLSTIPSGAFGASETPRSVVETIIERASKLDQKATRPESERIIESQIDFQKLALDALGDNANEATSAQRTQIQDLLRKIITKTVYPEAPKFFRDVKIQYTGEEKSVSDRTHITSIVTKGSKRSTVEYWLAPGAQGYKVVDFAIEGERWVENVGDQFDEVIAKNKVSGLISKMNKRLGELERNKKK